MVWYYFTPNTIVELHKKLECDKSDKIDSILKKYSKYSNLIDKIMDKIEMLRNVKAMQSEEFVAKRVKSRKQKIETLKKLTVKKKERAEIMAYDAYVLNDDISKHFFDFF